MDETDDTWHGRAILHVDMDAFFASVEQLDHPEWRGRPVVVGGSPTGRGVVSAASYEARVFGIRSAMPAAQAARLCPSAVWAKPRFERYGELSRRVCEIFREVTPAVEQVSIDEAYLDVTPTASHADDPVEIARAIQKRVDALGLSCSIGVAPSKTVAKIASDHDKPHGITVVRAGEEPRFLAPLPVRSIPGVGSATAEHLRSVGIRTLGELAALDPESARQLLGSQGPGLVARAAGIDDRPVGEDSAVKSVSNEHTFARDVRERAEVEAEVRRLAQKVASRLRRKGLQGRTLTVKLRYADFTTRSASRTIAQPTDLEQVLVPVALDLIGEVWTAGAGLRLLGFGVSGFGRATTQLELLAESPRDGRPEALAHSIDAVRSRFGPGSIGFGKLKSAEHAGEED